ncbi:probably inactive receptor-like protein kinase At5g41680 isoform X4 [Lathyrus oleraceus]|uniref:probably inactive receptor-like protein kinase At5g41680 isoform X4 n=1 Tax=Pisum sativum TaxID=3888 RepID=UPI0021CFAA0A|nr:probably inactive receptor-like protein kinase At5g41680 isoform X4 [Pisum sativum]
MAKPSSRQTPCLVFQSTLLFIISSPLFPHSILSRKKNHTKEEKKQHSFENISYTCFALHPNFFIQSTRMRNKMALLFFYSETFIIGAMFFICIGAEPVADKQALLDFLHNMNHSAHLNWNKSSSVCKNWTRVTCNTEKSRVISLQLQSVGLNGSIPPNTLGEIPDINIPSLKDLNLENNNLSGVVPKTLHRFPSLSFSGNNLTFVNVYPPNSHIKRKKHKGLKEQALLGIIIGGCVLGILIIAVFWIVCCYKKQDEAGQLVKSQKNKEVFSDKKEASESLERNKIVFFEDCNYVFDLEDLLRASAEVLGKGTFGTVYKAALEETTTVAVKRLKEVTVGKREFEQQMEMVGGIRHENVAALRAYYYSKEEKLMVYDFYEQGSVSAMLHGKRGADRIPLDWETRLRIAIGVARGIAHIHAIEEGKLVHANIKASNIFLNSKGYGSISDTGLATMIITPTSPRASGYLAPEVTETRKATPAADVYSFGVLLLELLTGKSPLHVGEEVVHLVRWVNSVVREEWTSEVFDLELLRYPNIEEEMVEMLQIGMACVGRIQDQRPKMDEVLRMVEEIHRGNSGNRLSTESRSDGSTPITPHVIETPISLPH